MQTFVQLWSNNFESFFMLRLLSSSPFPWCSTSSPASPRCRRPEGLQPSSPADHHPCHPCHHCHRGYHEGHHKLIQVEANAGTCFKIGQRIPGLRHQKQHDEHEDDDDKGGDEEVEPFSELLALTSGDHSASHQIRLVCHQDCRPDHRDGDDGDVGDDSGDQVGRPAHRDGDDGDQVGYTAHYNQATQITHL